MVSDAASCVPQQASRIDGWDIAVIFIYFGICIVVAVCSMFKSKRNTISGYFLAGRFMTWLPVGASLFASNIGSEHFIGLAGSGAAAGIAVGAFELNALIILQLLGWVFLPVYISSGVDTLPEYMSKRFGGQRIRVYLAVLSLLLYIVTKMSVNIYSGSLFVREALGWSLYPAILLILCITAVTTMTGGLKAVMYMDTMQCGLMIVGACYLAAKSFIFVGGYSGLVTQYMTSVSSTTLANSTCGLPNKHAFTMLRSIDDNEMPWAGFLFGQTFASIWYWAADQMMVQRALASKSLSHAQGATLFAGVLKILPLFIIVMPGMISRVQFPDIVACETDCMSRCCNEVSCSNLAYPLLVMELRSGLRGLMLAVILAALMSDLTSLFNSASTLFTLDIWRRIRTDASNREIMIVGRLFVLVMVILAVLWVPIIGQQQGGQLYIYIQSIAAYLSPPVAAVYVCAIMYKGTTEKGAFYGLLSGGILGIIRMCFEFVWISPNCGEVDERPFIVKIQYMYFAMILMLITMAITVIISTFTNNVESWRLIRTTYWTRFDINKREDDKKVQQTDGLEMTEISSLSGVHAEMSNVASNGEKNKFVECVKTSFLWICGLNEDISSSADTTGKTQETVHLLGVHGLQQSKSSKRILNTLLVLLILLTISIYCFFSLVTPVNVENKD